MKYVVTPTFQIPKKRDMEGRFFSLRPCDFCCNDGVTLELRSYGPPTPSYLNWKVMFQADPSIIKPSEEKFTTSDGYIVNYFCSEECITLHILKKEDHNAES